MGNRVFRAIFIRQILIRYKDKSTKYINLEFKNTSHEYYAVLQFDLQSKQIDFTKNIYSIIKVSRMKIIIDQC